MQAKLTNGAIDQLQVGDRPFDVRDTELRGFLVRVEPGGAKTFFFDYRIDGRRNRTRLGRYPNLSADGARRLAKRAAGDVAGGVDPQERKKEARRNAERARCSTLRAFLDDRYEPWAKTHLKSSDFQLARIRSDFATWLDRPMSEFDVQAAEGVRGRWKKAGLAAKSINRDLQRLQSVLSRAVEWGVLDVHPLAGLKLLKTDKTGRVRFLTPEEEARLRKALIDREQRLKEARSRFNAWRSARGKKLLPEREGELLDHLRPLVLLALNSGLRRGELLGLKWGDVNLPAKILTVTAVSAKSGHTRRVPLNAEALSVLTAWYERSGESKANAYVFPHDGERMKSVSKAWNGVRSAAALEDFRLHDCRHHFASRLAQAGVDLYTIKELLGHSEIAMTERYSHLAPDNLRLAVEKLSERKLP